MLFCWCCCFLPVPARCSPLIINFQKPYTTSVVTAESIGSQAGVIPVNISLPGASWEMAAPRFLRLSVVDLTQELSSYWLEDTSLCQASTSQRVQKNPLCLPCSLVVFTALTPTPPLDLQRGSIVDVWHNTEKRFLCCKVLLPVHIGFCPSKIFENLWPEAAFSRSCVINLKQSLPASPVPQLV